MTKNILAIIPVKGLDRTKSRLSGALSLSERRAFTLDILSRTVQLLHSSDSVERVLVLTPDDQVLSHAKDLGALGLKEKGTGLNRALTQATLWSIDQKFGAVLVIPCDLPLLSRRDIENISGLGVEEEKIVIVAPNGDRSGTNALLVKPPGILKYSFGAGSFSRHQSDAFEGQVKVKVYSSPSIEFDLDRPEQCRLPFAQRYFLNKVVVDEDKTRTFDSDWGDSPDPAGR
jgi:2-phospho-L-lactate/phosphoenolpyruvate guanylyltransferase